MIPDLRRGAVHLPNGNVLIDAAIRTNTGIPGNINPVQAVRQHRPAGKGSVFADVTTVPPGTAVEEKRLHCPQPPAGGAAPPGKQPPEQTQMIAFGIVDDLLAHTHAFIAPSMT